MVPVIPFLFPYLVILILVGLIIGLTRLYFRMRSSELYIATSAISLGIGWEALWFMSGRIFGDAWFAVTESSLGVVIGWLGPLIGLVIVWLVFNGNLICYRDGEDRLRWKFSLCSYEEVDNAREGPPGRKG